MSCSLRYIDRDHDVGGGDAPNQYPPHPRATGARRGCNPAGMHNFSRKIELPMSSVGVAQWNPVRNRRPFLANNQLPAESAFSHAVSSVSQWRADASNKRRQTDRWASRTGRCHGDVQQRRSFTIHQRGPTSRR